MLYNTGNLAEGLAAARVFLDRSIARYGQGHFNTALARGAVAIGLGRTGKSTEAVAEFKKSVDVLLSTIFESDEEDASASTAAQTRIRDIVEYYMGLLGDQQVASDEALGEAFRLSEAVRGSSVQKALVAASARMAVNNPTVGDLARKEQDLERQRSALLALLNNLLGTPAGERDEKVVAELRKQIDLLRTQRTASRKEIEKRFPRYADLVNPKPPRMQHVRASLKPGEAFVSVLFWSLPQLRVGGAQGWPGRRFSGVQTDTRPDRRPRIENSHLTGKRRRPDARRPAAIQLRDRARSLQSTLETGGGRLA